MSLAFTTNLNFIYLASMINYPIVIGEHAVDQLLKVLDEKNYTQVLVLVDENTHQHCYSKLQSKLPPHYLHQITSGEIHKHLGTCQEVWQKMTELNFDRKAVVLNLGGGVIGDMGGFIAGTYKRGIDFIQIPTTLLSQVDASVGSKLGVDFNGFKNHIGLFKNPVGVYIDPGFLDTLSQRELFSGFAEVIKHHLIADKVAWQHLKHRTKPAQWDIAGLIQHSVDIKARIVEEDPFEHGARKALNFGHTIGHAIESHYLESERPLLHGEAIAIGMLAEAYISWQRGSLTQTEFEEIQSYLGACYAFYPFPETDFPAIYARCLNDKKNLNKQIMCTLLDGPGKFLVNQSISESEILGALKYYQTSISFKNKV